MSSASGFGVASESSPGAGFSRFNTITGNVLRAPNDADSILTSVSVPVHNLHEENTKVRLRALVVPWSAADASPAGDVVAVSEPQLIPLTSDPEPHMRTLTFRLDAQLDPNVDYLIGVTTLYDIDAEPPQTAQTPISLGFTPTGQNMVSQLALSPAQITDPEKWVGIFAGARQGSLALGLVFDAPKAPFQQTLDVAAASTTYGLPVTLSATTNTAGEDGGNVVFSVAGEIAGEAPVRLHKATYEVSPGRHPAGGHVVQAEYSDDSGAQLEASGVLTVARAASTTDAKTLADPNSTGTIAVSVVGEHGTIPGGSVALRSEGGAEVATATLRPNGELTYSGIKHGAYIVAYSGDENHHPSDTKILVSSDADGISPDTGNNANVSNGDLKSNSSDHKPSLATTGTTVDWGWRAMPGVLLAAGAALLLSRRKDSRGSQPE